MCAKLPTKLTVELVPSTCHYSNVRTTVTPQQWDKIRFISYEKANNKCEICDGTGKAQGYKHNVECHEIWLYDDENKIQKLIGLISLCPTCHQVKHIGRAIMIGKENECYNQLAVVNGWSAEQVMQHITEAFEVHRERSQHEWTLDISILNEEPYSLGLKLGGKRKFKKVKYKKNKKKKAKLKKRSLIGKRPKKKF